jgi:periplasmic divalent cation tolerance protein
VVSRRLAACVNILPSVQSLFWWQGHVDQATETLLIIKTTAARFEALRRAVCALHPYEVPEVIALPIQRAHPPYLRWIKTCLKRS